MNTHDKELLRRIENLITSFQGAVKDAEDTPQEEPMVNALRGLVNLANMVLRQQDVFGIEPWHIISYSAPLSRPGEMLLRLKDYKGQPMAPYPMIMALYNNGYTPQIDGILFLAALGQFQRTWKNPDTPTRQISINVSARSLRDPDFVRCTLERLESIALAADQKIILEIHESSPHLTMSRQVLELYSSLGVGFAIDDVGLNMGDVLRLSEFEGLAEYIKIDRHAVNAAEGDSNSLKEVMNFLNSLMPEATLIAEGVKSAEHALQLSRAHPEIHYVQGLYLTPDRDKFKREYFNATDNIKASGAAAMSSVLPKDFLKQNIQN
jgi:EAL domain-containing protein (putative c-di-GMP-specific phosphodiesterase class I)